ncbi:receptor-like protein EIX2 [Cornus florida]|uniref:receptor-like protein EIX2 n=1 Tax=Cornus florida TaxID=4283 RepID=UPI00289FA24B|nr:receptor-like protein EIX2 [Cornus florida]
MYFIGFLCLGSVGYIMGGSLPNVQCMENEQEALLKFKEGLVNHWDRLFSWMVEEEADCCKWRGVKCNRTTGHVMALDLHSQSPNESLQGELNYSALLDLPYLTYLAWNLNDFKQSQIPQFTGSLPNLKYLNLSNANFRGNIPSDLGNLSRLHSLDLSSSSYHSLGANNLDWLRGLSSLKILDLGGVDHSKAVNWLNEINMLPSLVELHLFDCNLNKLPSSLPRVNFTSPEIIDLSLNSFNSPIPWPQFPEWLCTQKDLLYIDISDASISDIVPDWFWNISTKVEHMILVSSQLRGKVPDLSPLANFSHLDLGENNFDGPLPRFSANMKSLRLYGNSFSGPISSICEWMVANSSLVDVQLFSNKLSGLLPDC